MELKDTQWKSWTHVSDLNQHQVINTNMDMNIVPYSASGLVIYPIVTHFIVQAALRHDVSHLCFYMLSCSWKTDVQEKIKEKGAVQNIMFVHK